MRWGIFLIFALLGLALDTALLPVLHLEIGGHIIRPSSLALLATFIGLWAPRHTTLWAAFLIGLLVDAVSPWGTLVLFGPHALGYLFAAAMLLQLRSMVLRREVFAIAFLTALFSIAAGVVIVAILLVRAWTVGMDASMSWTASGELVRRLLAGIYSGVVAVPLAWAMFRAMPLWGFHATPGVRMPRR